MTLDEANTIAHLIGFADRGCQSCVHDLVDHANRLFPQFQWRVTSGASVLEGYQSEHDILIEDRRIPVAVVEKSSHAT